MNYYGSYSGNRKRKTLRRVVIVVVCALLIFGGTVLFGNHLKKKAADSSSPVYGGIGREDLLAETDTPAIIPPSEGGSGSSESVTGYCVPLQIKTDAENDDTDSFEDRLTAAAKDNSGVLIPMTGEDGFLLYNSARAAVASRLPANPELPDMAALGAAVSEAKSKGLRTTALIISSVDIGTAESVYDEAITADSRIAADAAEAGFDEIVITSLVASPEEITGDSSHVILRYLNQMTAAAGNTEVGLALPQSIYEVSTLSPQIELILSRSVFLAMELTTDKSTVEHLNYICENLAGTLSLYNMRMLLSPTNTTIAEKLEDKLEAVSHRNFLFTAVPETVKEEPQTPEETVTAS